METILNWLTEHADVAHYIIFILLLLTGFSLPISEDILLVASGVLASTVIPEKTVQLFLAAFLGSLLSDYVAYGIGRWFGDRIYKSRWFSRVVPEKKRSHLEAFYKQHGAWMIALGRCIPFGLRNGIFMTAGAGKMPFTAFAISDAIACFCFSAALFYGAVLVGKNYTILYTLINKIGMVMLIAVLLFILGYFIYKRIKKSQPKPAS